MKSKEKHGVAWMKITRTGIELERELSDLDRFAIRFSEAISRHTQYVIVSGYVSILLGRARASEDIYILLPEMDSKKWEEIYDSLVKKGFYCLNAENAEESYALLKDGLAVRFAPVGVVIPNIEILLSSDKVKKLALKTRIPVSLGKVRIFVSNLELQIAYKERVLKSPKDMEDARHLRVLLGKDINKRRLNEYEKMLYGL